MTLKPAEIGPKRASLEYIFAAALDAPRNLVRRLNSLGYEVLLRPAVAA